MREAHPLERAVGVEHYVSDAPGIGGRLRARDEEFRVRELETVDAAPLGADPGDYPYLLVRATLRGWDTNDFASALSDAMGASRERISWAGTKDRNAVTTQLFSVRDATPEDLPALGNADLEPVGRFGRNLEFGDLAGNEFRIVVRDARPERAPAITRELRAFARGERPGDGPTTGAADEAADDASLGAGRTRVAVPNLFGQQRFGSVRPVTHEVGLAIARGDWKGAVMAYLGEPSEDEPDDTRAARAFVEESRDWDAALDRFPHRLGFERTLLGVLASRDGEGPAAFRAALEALPWNLQRLFVNAAQSYAFNLTLGERLRRGLPFARPVPGDVVCFTETRGELRVPDPDRTQRVTDERVETVARHCERGRAYVTAPLVGTETAFAGGEPGEIERAVLDDLGLAPADFDLPGAFGSEGTRRAILVGTDLGVERAPEGENALAFEFALPKGSYATALLREYLKGSPLDL